MLCTCYFKEKWGRDRRRGQYGGRTRAARATTSESYRHNFLVFFFSSNFSVIVVSLYDRWRCLPYQTGKTVHVHSEHNAQQCNAPVMVLCPGTRARDKRGYLTITEGYFSLFLVETAQLRGHNICFCLCRIGRNYP